MFNFSIESIQMYNYYNPITTQKRGCRKENRVIYHILIGVEDYFYDAQ